MENSYEQAAKWLEEMTFFLKENRGREMEEEQEGDVWETKNEWIDGMCILMGWVDEWMDERETNEWGEMEWGGQVDVDAQVITI